MYNHFKIDMEISQSAILVISFIAIAVITFFTYKKKEEWFSRHKYPIAVWMVFVSFILSLTTFICVAFFNTEMEKCSFRYSDTSVAIITLLVTILVGWNIYTVIDVKNIKNTFDEENKKRDDRIEEISTKLDTDIHSVTDDIIYDVDIELNILYNLLSAKDRGSTDFLVCCINSFYMTKRIRNSFIFLRNMCMDYSLLMIKSTISIENEKSELSKDENFINRVSANAIKYLLEEFDSFSENEKEQKYKGVGNTLHEILRMKTKNKI